MQQIHLPGKVERGSSCQLNTTWFLVTQPFGLRGRQENYNSRYEHFKFAKNENGCMYVKFADSNTTKMRKSPIKIQERMFIPRMGLVVEKVSSWHF